MSIAPADQSLFERAIAELRAGALPDAERSLNKFLRRHPGHFGARNLLGILLIQLRRFPEAEAAIRTAIAVNAQSDSTFYNHGIVLKILGRPGDAIDAFGKAIAINSAFPEVWNGRGTAFNDMRCYQEAVANFERAIALRPDYVEALYNMAGSLFELGNLEQALAAYDRALKIVPNFAEALANRGQVLHKQERFADALANYDRALNLKPDFAEAHCYRGNTLSEQERFAEALTSYDRALAINPNFAAAHYNRGNALQGLKRFEQALQSYDNALAIWPSFTEAHSNRGNALLSLRRIAEALASHDRALAINPGYAKSHANRANALQEQSRFDEALASYDQALDLQPDLAEAHYDRGNALYKLKRLEDAFASYDRAFAIDPDFKFLMGLRLHTKMQLCDWRDLENESAQLVAAIADGRPASLPFPLLAVPSAELDRRKCAEIFLAAEHDLSAPQIWQGERYAHDRIRVAYVSADFREHPVSHLLAGLFEAHDRTRFKTMAISLGANDHSAMRARLECAFDQFLDPQGKTDADIARLMRDMGVDIAIDLMGYTTDSRPAIFLHRPAPIAINYLGYAATTAAPHIDYLIADKVVIPQAHQPHYSENVVYLPDTFFGYDSKQRISESAPTRAQFGLPESGLVLCAFNNAYKITPPMFDIWMRLLSAIDGSALWLSQLDEAAACNLRREAQARGIDAGRLIFAPRLERIEDHLARFRLANLFLDTLPYNAHTTASDALWAGVPVLTCRGETFAGRVAASLVNAAGLPDMATIDLNEYEALALKLARTPGLLGEIKAKLARNRATCSLFDTTRFARHIEAAYRMMWETWQRGETPKSFSVEPIGARTSMQTGA